MASINSAPSADTSIAIKLALNDGENRRFKLALRDLGANTLPDKLRSLLAIPPNQNIIFERFSDSAGSYITLDSDNPAVYKQLYRAAKAKLKLRLKATVIDASPSKDESATSPDQSAARGNNSPQYRSTLKLESVPIDQHLLSGPPTSRLDPAATLNLSPSGLGKHPNRPNSRPKLPYDPCSSPSVTATATSSLLDSANPVINAAKSSSMDYSMQLLLLEQQNKKRLLKARQNETAREAEAPVPHTFTAPEDLIPELITGPGNRSKSLKTLTGEPKFSNAGGSYNICCNKCQETIPDAHWHCSTCHGGDYDLCRSCIEKGLLCEGEDHWLIKRTIKNDEIINSTTETIAPKTAVKTESTQDVPKAPTSQSGMRTTEVPQDTSMDLGFDAYRTCNSCVEAFDDSNFVTCNNCEDFDLCLPCFVSLKHGHHPGHAFVSARPSTELDPVARALCAPGRNIRHFAICDGCDQDIYGVRHKCLNCPDWDFCSTCVKGARTSHPGHRFVPLNEPIPFANHRAPAHYGINCDGPLCKETKQYITGDRYKCAVCHDTDFCAKCEALPTNRHNRTHPLIKFKSPVRNVSVTTLGEKENGEHMCTMGDQLPPQFTSKATETVPVAPSANAATQVQTVAEVKPTDTVEKKAKGEDSKAALSQELQAHFIRDAFADGSVLAPGKQFEQVWTLRNPGPRAWPAGCSVRFVGGDNMFNVDPHHPSSVSDIRNATESNVIDRVVQVGDEIDFTVAMRTPERQGKAISYWRLKTADGVPFGHKLWCDIYVAPLETEVSKPSVPDCVGHVLVAKDTEDEETTHSQMIFPKLDKESPVSSTHEATGTALAPAAPSAAASATSAVTANEEKGMVEEIENLSLDDDVSSTEDGFLTDEEFEMLDASEDDFAEAANGRQKK
ncbi:MAG: hypothetical protein Q9211_002329 [Gyalolechia sp. 1 TL-2023]